MTIYQQIREAVPIGQAARRYGLAVSQGGMALCPFHHDTHPSLKLNANYLVSDKNFLKKGIYDGIKQHVTTGIPKKVSNLLEVLRRWAAAIKNEYGLKTRVPSVPNVPWYRSTLGTRVLTPRSEITQNHSGWPSILGIQNQW